MEHINQTNISQYYSVDTPVVGELVLVNFTERNDSFFDAKLIEYPYRGMMGYQLVTKKRKVTSWNKLVPLNKNMVTRVEEVDDSAKIVQLSLVYLSDLFDEELTPDKIQEKLLVHFNENKVMESFIKSLCIINEYNYKDIWENLGHYIDNLRREYNDENDENVSLWKYFSDNFGDLDNWLVDCELEDLSESIKHLYAKRTEEGVHKISSRIGIISIGGIVSTKELLRSVLTKLKYPYTFRYDTTPYYLFETSSENTNVNDHQQLVKILETESAKLTPRVFIKADCIGKRVDKT